jgi:hypothetical protein
VHLDPLHKRRRGFSHPPCLTSARIDASAPEAGSPTPAAQLPATHLFSEPGTLNAAAELAAAGS